MSEFLTSAGAFLFLACLVIFVISTLTAIISAIMGKNDVSKIALKVLLGSLIFGAIGFGVCAMNFTLGPMH